MKICVICFDFKRLNVNRQPWKYLYKICKSLVQNGVNLKVISNDRKQTLENDLIDGISVRYLKRLNSIFGLSREALMVLREENADVVVICLGLTSLLRLNFKIDKPIIGVLTSPIYTLKDIIRLGLRENVLHIRYLLIHLADAIIPSFLVRKRISFLERVVVLSKANKKKLESKGVDSRRLVIIPPGIDEFYLKSFEEEINSNKRIDSESAPTILYFGAPLSLRGTDTLIKAFTKVCRNLPSKLVMLLRLDDKDSIKEENYLRKIIRKNGITHAVKILSGLLDKKELKSYFRAADVICLPFKLVISDVPITILEAMAAGKPVISTDVDGITELLDGRGLVIKHSNPDELAKFIEIILANPKFAKKLAERARNYTLSHPRWPQIGEDFMKLVNDVLGKKE